MRENGSLRRELNLFNGVALVSGIMVGSGIFYVSSYVLARTGLSAGLDLLAWAAAGVMSLMAALCYAELGTSLAKGGGNYTYLSEALGPGIGFSRGFTDFFIASSGSISALAMGFATYFSLLVPLSAWQIKALAIGLIILLTLINLAGVKSGGRLQNVFMVAQFLPILLIIVCGLALGTEGLTLSLTPGQDQNPVAAFSLAVVAALWAYDGWTGIFIVSEEMESPQKDLPRAILIGVVLVTLLYMLFNVALLKIHSPEAIAATEAPAALAAETLLGGMGGVIVTVGALLAILASCNGCVLANPREIHVMARDKRFFRALAYVSPGSGTPVNAQLAMLAVSIALILMGSFEQLISLVAICEWMYHALVIASIFVLRKKRPEMERPYRVWGYPVMPAFALLLTLTVLAATFIEAPTNAVGILIPVLGWILYHLYFKKMENRDETLQTPEERPYENGPDPFHESPQGRQFRHSGR